MTTRTMDKKTDELKTYLEERLTAQETNLKELCNNLMEKISSELTGELKIQAERINQLENEVFYKNRLLNLKKKILKIELPVKKMNNMEEDFV